MSRGLKTRKWSREGAGLAQGLRADLQLQKSGPVMRYQDTRSWHRACEPLSPPPAPAQGQSSLPQASFMEMLTTPSPHACQVVHSSCSIKMCTVTKIVLQFMDRPPRGSKGRANDNLLQKDLCQPDMPPRIAAVSIPDPAAGPLLTQSSAGDSQTLKGRTGSVSCDGHFSFSCALVHTRFCLCTPSISGRYEA